MAVADFKPRCLEPVFYGLRDDGTYKCMYPCGKCVLCLERKRLQWTARMEMESQYSKSCYFVTLTYSDDNLPYVFDIPTLDKSHYQNFLKRLRNKTSFRFFGVGEYGSESQRPHYHFMFFLKKPLSKENFRKLIGECWTFGFNTVKNGKVQRMYYIAKYCCKLGGAPLGALPSFQSSSINPPIGYDYFIDNISHLSGNICEVNYMMSPSFNRCTLPRSFEMKFRQFLDSLPLDSADIHQSLLVKRSHSIYKKRCYKMRDYLNEFNNLPNGHFNEICQSIIRRYNKKNKKSQI